MAFQNWCCFHRQVGQGSSSNKSELLGVIGVGLLAMGGLGALGYIGSSAYFEGLVAQIVGTVVGAGIVPLAATIHLACSPQEPMLQLSSGVAV